MADKDSVTNQAVAEGGSYELIQRRLSALGIFVQMYFRPIQRAQPILFRTCSQTLPHTHTHTRAHKTHTHTHTLYIPRVDVFPTSSRRSIRPHPHLFTDTPTHFMCVCCVCVCVCVCVCTQSMAIIEIVNTIHHCLFALPSIGLAMSLEIS